MRRLLNECSQRCLIRVDLHKQKRPQFPSALSTANVINTYYSVCHWDKEWYR